MPFAVLETPKGSTPLGRCSMANLTTRQRIFVEEYLRTWNATDAARKAGYKDPEQAGYENKLKPAVASRIQARLSTVASETNQAAIPWEHRRSVRQQQRGFVYVVQADNGLVKIGKALDFNNRLRTLNTMVPYDLFVCCVLDTENMSGLEAFLHREFAGCRVKGEWFRLSDEQIRSIPALGGQWT